ncbi:ATP-binding protein [Flavilitoribacter nigricans]|uniref:ORC1/DEAH AAA+ ATPase domain-containing protein n=1 Tax=Flavilitoribacter nigricans (strain ATCC 23147 / DSM 23189 / NBRC 102662 / NCIMB 1420 / SS-2) TaxID=1122177 RepID=A0A2D0MWL3_FLAN2|nr:ATP-binding protein [Flavilitoribacter nigricans]PHN00654.1 hypothetical protein CRP01_41065 [Flavilitoribacter nigricans DSM 23189 = NBRC 102662]
MTNEHKQRILSAIEAYKVDKKLSQNQMANVMGISNAQASSVFNPGKWDNVSNELWQRLESMFVKHDWVVYETENFRAIQSVCADSQQFSMNHCISEYTGAGKTTALESYAKQTPHAYYVLCDQMMTPKDLAREIQRVMGINVDGNARLMAIAIVTYLVQQSRPVILIDEADKLSDRCLMMLKMIYDRLENRCGFVTAGTEVLRERIEKFARRNKLGYREIERRFANYKSLVKFDPREKTIQGEILMMCKDQGITTKGQITHILKHARHYDDVRKMIVNFQRLNAKTATAELEEVAA